MTETEARFPVLFRVLGIGKAGNAAVGGPYEGLDGLGIAAAMTTAEQPKSNAGTNFDIMTDRW